MNSAYSFPGSTGEKRGKKGVHTTFLISRIDVDDIVDSHLLNDFVARHNVDKPDDNQTNAHNQEAVLHIKKEEL